MKTIVNYRINCVRGHFTYVYEYWDDILIYKWRVDKPYRGGDILDFLETNKALRIPDFDGLEEYHRRTFILDL